MRQRSRQSIFAACLLAMLAPAAAHAVKPDEILPDPALEARARALSAELRCLVCQNQSIDDSDAPLARDLRLLVRERLKANDTDEQVMAYVVERYGDFVLLKPPVNSSTLILWVTPVLALLAALALAYKGVFRRSSAVAAGVANDEAPLTAEEKARLERVLKNGESA
jgi:cytochrome c-type biogenesis protein CcmH